MTNYNLAELIDLAIFEDIEAVKKYLQNKNINENEIETIIKIIKEYLKKD